MVRKTLGEGYVEGGSGPFASAKDLDTLKKPDSNVVGWEMPTTQLFGRPGPPFSNYEMSDQARVLPKVTAKTPAQTLSRQCHAVARCARR